MSVWDFFKVVSLVTSVVLFVVMIHYSTESTKRGFRRIPLMIVVMSIIGTLVGALIVIAIPDQNFQSRARIAKIPPTGNQHALKQQLDAELTDEWRKLRFVVAVGIVAAAGCVVGAATGQASIAGRACGIPPLLAVGVVGKISDIKHLKSQLRALED